MAGKKGRSGRRPGSTSWGRNPTALAGHHLNGLIEMWLGGAPIRFQTPDGERERWLEPPTERRHTVPLRIRRVLATVAIEHTIHLYPHRQRPDINRVIEWSRRRAPDLTLRTRRRKSAF